MSPTPPLKPLESVGSALEDLQGLPEPVQDVFGYALHLVQLGEHPRVAKRLKGELSGLIELLDEFDGDAYRAVYTVRLAGAVYVLHVFQKKSTRGIATPRREIALIKERYARARAHHAAHYGSREDAK